MSNMIENADRIAETMVSVEFPGAPNRTLPDTPSMAMVRRAAREAVIATYAVITSDLEDEVRDALEGDSNDAEHSALYEVASYFGIEHRDPYDWDDDDEEEEEED